MRVKILFLIIENNSMHVYELYEWKLEENIKKIIINIKNKDIENI